MPCLALRPIELFVKRGALKNLTKNNALLLLEPVPAPAGKQKFLFCTHAYFFTVDSPKIGKGEMPENTNLKSFFVIFPVAFQTISNQTEAEVFTCFVTTTVRVNNSRNLNKATVFRRVFLCRILKPILLCPL